MKRIIKMVFLLTLIIVPVVFFVLDSKQVLAQNKNGLTPSKAPAKSATRSVYASFILKQ